MGMMAQFRGNSAHAPRVAVLVADFLLHLGIGEGLEEGGPDAGITLVPSKKLNFKWVPVPIVWIAKKS